jgi:NNP family nitrate/nitrite transporter-like MFS transporter
LLFSGGFASLSLGLGTGGVFALVARLVEPARVGAVTGLVGAAGGLGGYFPPLVMGATYQALGSYAIGYLLLAGAAAAALAYSMSLRKAVTQPSPVHAN